MSEAMERLENFFDSKIKGNAEAFGVPVFYNEDLDNLQKKINLNIANYEPNLEKIAAIVDKDTHEVLKSLSANAGSIQRLADTVFTNFERFVDLEPIKFNDVPVNQATFGENRITAMYEATRADYTNRIFELHKEAMDFNERNVNFNQAEHLLHMQNKLATSDSLFSRGIDPTTIVPITNLVEKMKSGLVNIRDASVILINKLKEVNEPDRLKGNNLKDGKDPLYFEVIVVYLDYIYEVYALEKMARKIQSTVLYFEQGTPIPTKPVTRHSLEERLMDKFESDLIATNSGLKKTFKKIDTQAKQDTVGLEHYSTKATLTRLKAVFNDPQKANRELRTALNSAI